MICTYLRASSINQHKLCEMRYLFEYVLNKKSPTGKKACLGSMFHKVMEVRSLAQIANLKGDILYEDDQFGILTIDEARDIDKITDLSFDHYVKLEPHLQFDEADRKTVKKWIHNTLEKYSEYDPFNLNVIAAELYFDIEIDKPWAKYSTVIQGETIEGNLRIKGTMDTVLDLGSNMYEMYDFKTGTYRTDFATGEVKDLEYLKKDVQLLLYLLALKHIYPDKEFIMTLAYINAGGIFSVVGDEEMYEAAWNMLEKEFKKITKNYNPTQLDPTHRDFRCKYLCPLSKPSAENPRISICNHMKNEISKNGFTKTVANKINLDAFGKYGTGGGRVNVENG